MSYNTPCRATKGRVINSTPGVAHWPRSSSNSTPEDVSRSYSAGRTHSLRPPSNTTGNRIHPCLRTPCATETACVAGACSAVPRGGPSTPCGTLFGRSPRTWKPNGDSVRPPWNAGSQDNSWPNTFMKIVQSPISCEFQKIFPTRAAAALHIQIF